VTGIAFFFITGCQVPAGVIYFSIESPSSSVENLENCSISKVFFLEKWDDFNVESSANTELRFE
jgi:hypothetical protein